MFACSLPVAALLIGLASATAVAQTRPVEPVTDAAATRTMEQNRKVSVGVPPATMPRAAEAGAMPSRRLALVAKPSSLVRAAER